MELDQSNGNVTSILQWASQLEVSGNYELSDGDMVHGWQINDSSWDWRKPHFEAKVHGDGMSGDHVWISAGAKPRGPMEGTYWCMVVLDSNAYRNMWNEIHKGEAV